jgi:amino-acid N-acetyltransferase
VKETSPGIPVVARLTNEAAIKELLVNCDLPYTDITTQYLRHYLTVWDDAQLVGVVGLEMLGNQALLRSLAVHPAKRGRGYASRLVREIEVYACEQNIKALYLLTVTAEGFFVQRGYRKIEREAVPAAVAATIEFQRLCPDSAVCMAKELLYESRSL